MRKMRWYQRAYMVAVFGFLYVPIAVLIAFSFNESKSRTVFTGFTFKWYENLFSNEMILKSLGVSLLIAFISASIATVLGTTAAIVSTLLTTVGQPYKPAIAGKGGLIRGFPLFPSNDSSKAVSSPQI